MPPKQFRFHILGLTHVPTAERFVACAFSQKIHKLCGILTNLGHIVFFYGCESSDVVCTEFIQTHTLEELREAFGDKKEERKLEKEKEKEFEIEESDDFELGYDYKKLGFRVDWNGNEKPLTYQVHSRMVTHILARKKPNDYLLLTMGLYHKQVANSIGLFLTCEPCIGYLGSWCSFRGFESSFMMHYTYGRNQTDDIGNGKHYDRIIPNYYYLKDFDFCNEPEDYFVYLGRFICRKGIAMAYETCKHTKFSLKLAGQGWKEYDKKTKTLTDQDGNVWKLTENMEFIGYVNAKERNSLLRKAKGVFCPSIYMEPFCGVNVEAQLCGTPVITTNFGAFTDTVEDGITGFRCDTLNDFVEAAKNIHILDRKYIRERAVRLYSCENVSKLFEKWFVDLYDVYESTLTDENGEKKGKGWYNIREND